MNFYNLHLFHFALFIEWIQYLLFWLTLLPLLFCNYFLQRVCFARPACNKKLQSFVHLLKLHPFCNFFLFFWVSSAIFHCRKGIIFPGVLSVLAVFCCGFSKPEKLCNKKLQNRSGHTHSHSTFFYNAFCEQKISIIAGIVKYYICYYLCLNLTFCYSWSNAKIKWNLEFHKLF